MHTCSTFHPCLVYGLLESTGTGKQKMLWTSPAAIPLIVEEAKFKSG